MENNGTKRRKIDELRSAQIQSVDGDVEIAGDTAIHENDLDMTRDVYRPGETNGPGPQKEDGENEKKPLDPETAAARDPSSASCDDDEELLGRFARECEDFEEEACTAHDAKDETFKLAGFHPLLAGDGSIPTDFQKILGEALAKFKAAEFKDASTTKLENVLLKLQEIPEAKVTTIGLVGNSGVGKSSLVNSLLDIPGLAIVGSAGACTNVTIQYQAPFVTQGSKKFKVEVRLFEERQIRQSVKSFYQDAVDGLDLSKSEEGDDVFSKDAKLRAETALEALVALFREHEDFASSKAAENFIWGRKAKRITSIPNEFSTWTRDLLNKFHVEEGAVDICADSLDELKSLLEPYVRVPSGGVRPSCWPLIKHVRVGLHSPFLERGIVLVDLPGLSDVNRIRTQTTQKFQRQCDLIFVVASSLRIESTPDVLDHLAHNKYAVGTRKVLVCTKIDDLGGEASPLDLGASLDDENDYNERRKVLLRLDEHVAALNAEAKALKSQKVRGQQSDAVNGRLYQAKNKKMRFEALIRQALIKMRRKQIATKMKEVYRTNCGDSTPLEVQAVSNTEYMKYRVGDDANPIALTGENIGVRTLRLLASTRPSKERFDRTWNFWTSTMPQLIFNLEDWQTQATIPRFRELLKIVEVPLTESGVLWEDFIQKLEEQIQVVLLSDIQSQLERWTQYGTSLNAKWQKMKAVPFAAQSKSFGEPKPVAKKPKGHNWNYQLLVPVRKYETPWEQLGKALYQVFDDAEGAWTEPLNRVVDAAKDFEGVKGDSLRLFMGAVRQKKEDISKLVPNIRQQLDASIGEIHNEATGSDDEGYLEKKMELAYYECKGHSGKGYTKECRRIIELTVTSGSPYQAIMNGLTSGFGEAIEELKDQRKTDLQDIYENFIIQFNSKFHVEERNNPKRDALVTEISTFIESAKAGLDGPVRDKFRKIIGESTETPLEHRQQRVNDIELWHKLRR